MVLGKLVSVAASGTGMFFKTNVHEDASRKREPGRAKRAARRRRAWKPSTTSIFGRSTLSACALLWRGLRPGTPCQPRVVAKRRCNAVADRVRVTRDKPQHDGGAVIVRSRPPFSGWERKRIRHNRRGSSAAHRGRFVSRMAIVCRWGKRGGDQPPACWRRGELLSVHQLVLPAWPRSAESQHQEIVIGFGRTTPLPH